MVQPRLLTTQLIKIPYLKILLTLFCRTFSTQPQSPRDPGLYRLLLQAQIALLEDLSVGPLISPRIGATIIVALYLLILLNLSSLPMWIGSSLILTFRRVVIALRAPPATDGRTEGDLGATQEPFPTVKKPEEPNLLTHLWAVGLRQSIVPQLSPRVRPKEQSE